MNSYLFCINLLLKSTTFIGCLFSFILSAQPYLISLGYEDYLEEYVVKIEGG
jgi:hypothetical protein